MQIYVTPAAEIEQEAIGEILKERGHVLADIPEGALVLEAKRQKASGYLVEKDEDHVIIYYGGVTEFFRGLGEALACLDTKKIILEQEGCSGNHGVMYDCSRNGVLREEQIREYIRLQALMGLNQMYLYTEDTYEVKGYPYFGALRGRYTKEEIQRCDAYAKKFGVELVPCIQTLAHLRTVLRWPQMMEYRDDEDILLAEEEKTYQLIDAMLKSVKEMYTSKKIHLGMDEAFYLGYGNYRKKHGLVNQGELIKTHLEKVVGLCRKYELEPIIWSDMFFVTPGEGDYYGVPESYEWPNEEKPDLDVALVYWDYYSHEKDRYVRMAKLHKKLTDHVIFAGGGWIWNGLAPNYAKAKATLQAGLAGVQECEVTDTFLTLWLDNGAETPMETGLPMMAFYSRCVYGKKPEGEEMERWFRALTGESYEDMLLWDLLDHIPGTSAENEEFANPSKMLLYQDVMTGIFDCQFAGMYLPGYYEKIGSRLEEAEKRAGKRKPLFHYYRQLARVLAGKAELGIDIRKAYLRKDKAALEHMVQEELPELGEQVSVLQRQREEIWNREYKPNGYEVLDIRLGGVETRLHTAGRRISAYLNGQLERLEELEEERLPYLTQKGKVPSCNLWEHIVSASNIKGV